MQEIIANLINLAADKRRLWEITQEDDIREGYWGEYTGVIEALGVVAGCDYLDALRMVHEEIGK